MQGSSIAAVRSAAWSFAEGVVGRHRAENHIHRTGARRMMLVIGVLWVNMDIYRGTIHIRLPVIIAGMYVALSNHVP